MITINKDIKFKDVYSTKIINDNEYDIDIVSNMLCDKLIIYCDSFERNIKMKNKNIVENGDNYCFTLIIKAKNIQSSQLFNLLRKEKIKKLFGL